MKTTALLRLSSVAAALAAAITATNIAIAEDYTLASAITDVTVYPSSARVVRTAQVELAAGNHSVIIPDLPSGLIHQSLRITAPDGSEIIVGNANLRQRFQSERSLAQAESLETNIQSLQQDLLEANDRVERLESQIELVQALGHSDGSSAYQKLPMEQWQDAWQLLEDQVADYQAERREAEQEIDDIKKQITLAQRQLDAIGKDPRAVYEAEVEVYSPTDQSIELSMTYQINNAYWSPIYDINLDTDTKAMTIETLATISQSTEEDWENVNLRLSTYRPSANAQLPDLWPWTLSLYDPQVSIGGFSGKAVMDRATIPSAAMEKVQHEIENSSAPPAPVAILSNNYRTEYVAPKPVSLSSGNQDKRIALQSHTFDSTVNTVAVPQLSEQALIIASIEYDNDAILLPGNASLYMDHQFVGTRALPATQSGERLKLSMGEDDNVRISFLPDPNHKSESGVFSKEETIESHFLVRIDNQHNTAKHIIIEGHFPVSEDDEITVKRLGDAPTRTDLDDKKGVVAWEYDIESGAEQALKFGCQVSYPADQAVNGL